MSRQINLRTLMTKNTNLLFALVLFLSLSSFQAQASQPISVSLAECSTIFEVMSISAAEKGKPDKQIQRMRKGAEAFKNDAYKRASTEGRSDAKSFIDNKLIELNQKWTERWLTSSDMKALSQMDETMEWVQYCAALGKERKILPIKE